MNGALPPFCCGELAIFAFSEPASHSHLHCPARRLRALAVSPANHVCLVAANDQIVNLRTFVGLPTVVANDEDAAAASSSARDGPGLGTKERYISKFIFRHGSVMLLACYQCASGSTMSTIRLISPFVVSVHGRHCRGRQVPASANGLLCFVSRPQGPITTRVAIFS
jgi:hypothetical protein